MHPYILKKNFTVYIFYASETGLSESVAQCFYEKMRKKSIKVIIDILDNFSNYKIEEGDLHFLFISTTYQGEIPSNGRKFYKYIKLIDGKKINYSLIAFGDSSYENAFLSSDYANQLLKNVNAKCFNIDFIDDQKNGNEFIDDCLQKNMKYVIDYRNYLFNWFINSMNNNLQEVSYLPFENFLPGNIIENDINFS